MIYVNQYFYSDITLNSKVYVLVINEGVLTEGKPDNRVKDSKLASKYNDKNAEIGVLFETYRSTQAMETRNLI